MKLLFIISAFFLFPFQTSKTADSDFSTNEHLVLATLYHQVSPEYKALCIQAFELAKLRLEKDFESNGEDIGSGNLLASVVIDIDETVLDNSPYEAYTILQNTNYPNGWKEWCNSAKAEPIMGAVDFLKFADSLGYQIFYVTNRKIELYDVTVENLEKWGCPQVKKDHLMMREKTSSKVERRDRIAENHQIVLLIGDNLNDFDGAFETDSSEERTKVLINKSKEIGVRFIILPNVMYGAWEMNIYKNSTDEDIDKTALRHNALKDF